VVVEKPEELLGLDVLDKAAECLRTLAHPHRLRIIQILLRRDESVGELAKACELPSHMVSEHLRLLRDRGFLENQRQGRKIFYKIAEPALADIMHCVERRFGQPEGGVPVVGKQ
jgi:ArsR family transcriptional regulator, zinc-responsive transcriptional repressor